MKKNIIYFSAFASLLLVFFFWWDSSGQLFTEGFTSALLAMGRLYGLLAVYFVLWQFLLAGRMSLLETTFGLDTLSRIHQKNGKVAITFILLHPIFIILSYSMAGKISLWSQIVEFVTQYEDMLQAIIAVGLFVTVVCTSVYIARKHLRYETWYFVHLLTYLAVLLAYGHQLELGGDFVGNTLFTLYWYFLYAIVFGSLFFFRFFLPVYRTWKHGFYVSEIVQETKNTVSYYIEGKDMKGFGVKGGQFMIFRFLSKGLWHEAHPFSLSALNNGKRIRITAKKAGDFTHKLPGIKPGTKVVIDGPYGIFTSKSAVTDKILFLAGGVGITPIRSLIEEMGPLKKDMILLYQNKSEDEIVFRKEIDALASKFNVKMIHIISNDLNFKGEHGEISEGRIQKFAPDFLERDIYFCGSPVFLHKTMHLLKALKVQKSLMHYEQFSFHF